MQPQHIAGIAAGPGQAQQEEAPRWEVVSSSPEPVIGPADAVPHGVFQGFETGQYTKVDGTHHVAINELGLCEHVTWDRTTRAALWSAPNGSGPWTRVTTLRNTSSMHSVCNLTAGKGLPNACSWAPTLVFAPSTANGSKPVWHLFYSACEENKKCFKRNPFINNISNKNPHKIRTSCFSDRKCCMIF